MEPLVSVIVTNYNSGDFLEQCILSIKEQSYRKYEIIVVDDCSSDESTAFLEAHKDVTLITLNENWGGPAKPRNVGIRASNGRYVAFCDADDIWSQHKLRQQMDILRSTDAIFCSTLKVNFFLNPPYLPSALPHNSSFELIKIHNLFLNNVVVLSSVVVDKDKLKGLNFSEDRSLIAIEDYDLWLSTLSNNGTGVLLKEELVAYRVHGENISKNKFRQARNYLRLLTKHTKHHRRFLIPVYFLSYAIRGIGNASVAIAKRLLLEG